MQRYILCCELLCDMVNLKASNNNGHKSSTHPDSFYERIHPITPGCEECEKERTLWFALRLCLECGHVGCCDSSIGLHGAKHYRETGHPVIIALHLSHGNGAMWIKHICLIQGDRFSFKNLFYICYHV